jgi:hypothetical protein
MSKLVTLFGILFTGLQLANSQEIKPTYTRNDIFDFGEELTYKATFLGMTAGKATTRVDKTHHKILGNNCYKIEVIGETSDWISWVTRVKDTWGAYVDTTNLLTRASFRNIREGKHKKDEWVTFDHKANKVSVQVVDKKTGQYKPAKVYNIPANATDLVGGFMQLRFFDLDNIKKGDTLRINGFFEDTSYTLKVLYTGKDVVKTKVGKIPCHVLTPVMPKNEMFDGANSITIWISNDKNKIPVKFSAKMFVGHTGIELTGFKGLKHGLRLVF